MNFTNQSKKTIKNEELFLQYTKTKNIEIRNEIFYKYLYIAEIISRKYDNRGIEYEDIYQIACLALILAIERFDVSKGFEFTSFATPTIVGEIKRYFRDKGWAIKIPRKMQEISKKINDYMELLYNELNKTPSVKEIAIKTDCTEEEILEALEIKNLFNPKSFDVAIDINEEKDISLKDMIGQEELLYEKIENEDFIEKSFQKLNKLEKDIVIKRFFNKKTQNEIAKELNISQMTVSRIEKKSIEKLKKELNR